MVNAKGLVPVHPFPCNIRKMRLMASRDSVVRVACAPNDVLTSHYPLNFCKDVRPSETNQPNLT